MQTMFASHAPGEVIDAIRPDLEAFTTLWTALRVNYEGTNITRTVARLLHMYQPEEGVTAYERLLRTLFVLLEDFDSDGLQLLVSMVPPPKGVSDEIVKEVFYTATGFVRVDAPIFHKNTHTQYTSVSSSTPTPILGTRYSQSLSQPCPSSASQIHVPLCQSPVIQEQKDGVSPPKEVAVTEIEKRPKSLDPNETTSVNQKENSPQISQDSSEVFRGFPPSEIFNTQSHVQSIKNFYRPLTNYSFSQPRPSFVNFARIVGQSSGQIQQPFGSGLVETVYRPKWFPNPYLIQKNSYLQPQYQDFYLKTVNNQYVRVPAAKVNNFHQTNVNASHASYQNLYSAHDYLRNRSNTVTSGLLEEVRHHNLQKADVKKIISKSGLSTKSEGQSLASNAKEIPADSQENSELEAPNDEVAMKKEEQAVLDSSISKTTNTNANLKTSNSGVKTGILNHQLKTLETVDEKNDNAPSNRVSKVSVENPVVNSENFEEFAKEVRMRQRAIQEDIYKMDVVCSDIYTGCEKVLKEEVDNQSIKPEMLTASEELRTSCKKFIDRVKTEEIIEIPTFPRTRALSRIIQQPIVLQPAESNLWKLLTSKNASDSVDDAVTTRTTIEAVEVPESPLIENTIILSPVEGTGTRKLALPVSVSVPKRVIRKKKMDVSTTKSKNQRATLKGPPPLSAFQDDYSPGGSKPNIATQMNSNSQEFANRCPPSMTQQTAPSAIGPATTMAELTAYKKQYYDALLSIQKAKAAVANSLAISSVRSPSGFNPYYYNYLQQQQQRNQILQRHQHQFFMGHQFSRQQSLRPICPPWFRNTDWRFPVIGQSQLPNRPQVLHSTPSLWPPRTGFTGRESQSIGSQNQTPNILHQSKPPLKRRKLEEIVGKLKETESNGTNI